MMFLTSEKLKTFFDDFEQNEKIEFLNFFNDNFFFRKNNFPENFWEKLFRLESAAAESRVAAGGAGAAPRAVSATPRRKFSTFPSKNIFPETFRKFKRRFCFSGNFRKSAELPAGRHRAALEKPDAAPGGADGVRRRCAAPGLGDIF